VQEEGAHRGFIPAPNIQDGTRVWLHSRHGQTTMPTRILDGKCLGPFKVVHQISPYAHELELPESIQIHRVQPVSLLDPVSNDPLRGQRIDPPPPVEVDCEEENQVSSVEDSLIYRNQLQYLIRWTGYDSLTWEPAMFVDGFQAIGELHQQYPMKPGPLEDVLREPGT